MLKNIRETVHNKYDIRKWRYINVPKTFEMSKYDVFVVSFIEQEINKDETKKFKNYLENQGVDYVIIRRLHFACSANE